MGDWNNGVCGYFSPSQYNQMVDNFRKGPEELDNTVSRLKTGLEIFLGYFSDLNNVDFDEEGLWVGGPPPNTFPTTVLYTLAKAQWRYDEGYKGWLFDRIVW